jgi:hypothetical protein
MGSAHRRRQFLAGHWLARIAAVETLGIDVDGCTLVQADDGSPRLQVDGRQSDWHVSLTHSGEWVACALAPAPVGVDLEMPRPRRDLLGLAAFAFSPDECRRLEALVDADRSDEFHRLWSLKEARGKRLGEGLLPRRSRASSIPATSLKVTRPCFSVNSRARDLPKPIALPPPDCIWRMKKIHTPISSNMGNHDTRTPSSDGMLSSTGAAVIRTPRSFRRPTRFGSSGAYVLNDRPSEK